MSDDNYGSDLHAWIEPEIEARVVALIFGEASPFEAEEIERLMDERPEIRAFKRRMESVHGLLGNSLAPDDDDQWELSPERKAEVLTAIGGGELRPRPLIERLAGRLDGALDILGAPFGNLGQDLFGGRIDGAVGRARLGFDPGAVDKETPRLDGDIRLL